MQDGQRTETLCQGHRCLSGSVLKLLAVVCMFIDHYTHVILVHEPRYQALLCTVNGVMVTPCFLLRTVGRIAFPIYCFLLVEGFMHTHSHRAYARNLLAFALISEIPFDLALYAKTFYPMHQNVFWTLLLGYAGLCAYERRDLHPTLRAAIVIGLGVVAELAHTDYGASGYGLILMLHLLRDDDLARTALGCCVTSAAWRAGLAFIPINLYDGRRGFIRGPVLKFAFYAFYPAHLLLLWRLAVGA